MFRVFLEWMSYRKRERRTEQRVLKKRHMKKRRDRRILPERSARATPPPTCKVMEVELKYAKKVIREQFSLKWQEDCIKEKDRFMKAKEDCILDLKVRGS